MGFVHFVVMLPLVFTLLLIRVGFDARKNRKPFRRTKTQSIQDAAGDGLVMIHGTVCPSEEGLVDLPILGRPVVWYSLTLLERPNGFFGSNIEQQILKESGHRAFLLDDGSGECAIVEPGGAVAWLEKHTAATCGQDTYATREFESYLASRHLTSRDATGHGRILRCEVQYVEPGDVLHVVGTSRRLGQRNESPYRSAKSSQIVLSQNSQQNEPLGMTTRSAKEIRQTRHIILGYLALAYLVAVIVGVLIDEIRKHL